MLTAAECTPQNLAREINKQLVYSDYCLRKLMHEQYLPVTYKVYQAVANELDRRRRYRLSSFRTALVALLPELDELMCEESEDENDVEVEHEHIE